MQVKNAVLLLTIPFHRLGHCWFDWITQQKYLRMRIDHKYKQRRSIRLKGYDYSQPGWYFVTIVTKNRECLFGEVVDEKMVMNEYGEIVKEELLKSTRIRKEISIDQYTIMPNHLHAVIIIRSRFGHVRATGQSPLHTPVRPGPKPHSLGSFMVGFQTGVTQRINKLRGTPGAHVWHRNYHDRIIRNEKELYAVKKYIKDNPRNWMNDREHPRFRE